MWYISVHPRWEIKLSACPTCSRYLGDPDLPSVWIILHNGQVRGVRANIVDAITQAHAIAKRAIDTVTNRSTLYVSRDGTHTIKVERYLIT